MISNSRGSPPTPELPRVYADPSTDADPYASLPGFGSARQPDSRDGRDGAAPHRAETLLPARPMSNDGSGVVVYSAWPDRRPKCSVESRPSAI